jgi:hypothetical protein
VIGGVRIVVGIEAAQPSENIKILIQAARSIG